MRCIECNTVTNRKCKICGTVYCSEACQEADSHNHIVFCHPHLHQRIKSCVDYAISQRCDANYNLSAMYAWDKCRLTPFGQYAYDACAVCGQPQLRYSPAYKCQYPTTMPCLRSYLKMYHLCMECEQAKKRLCPVTLAETGLCFALYCQPNWLTLLACLKHCGIRMPKDIKRLIFRKVNGCHHV